jgi:RNA polymerase sigma-70 factor (ECF subfamily)
VTPWLTVKRFGGTSKSLILPRDLPVFRINDGRELRGFCCDHSLAGKLSDILLFVRQVNVALLDIDRKLLQRCLSRQPRAWEDFVDRFLGLVVHVVNHSAKSRSIRLSPQDQEDLSAEVFLTLVQQDFAVLRRFRGESSLATYLTVVARRVVVRELLKRKVTSRLGTATESELGRNPNTEEERISNREEVERLLKRLNGPEAEVVRLYHLEGNSYREISSKVGMPENSVGPTLTRAREKMRQASAESFSP